MTIAHQYKIRKQKELEEKETLDFDPNLVSLKNSSIRIIDGGTARKVIIEYEWLKKMPMITNFCFGIYFNVGDKEVLGGVLVFSEEYALNTGVWKNRYKFENRIILLSRGVCLWWTPKNSASYFISKACKWIKRNTDYRVITATTDPSAGEIGTIYQSLNWDYIGVMQGNGNNKRPAYMIDGTKRTARWVRSKIGNMRWEEIKKHFPTAIQVNDERKRRYFYFLDNKYRKEIEHLILEYPKRDSEPTVGVVYKLTNKHNSMIYIGQTIRSLSHRMYEYETVGGHNNFLKNAINKYGIENFDKEILYEAKSFKELNEKEIYFIKLHDATNRNIGYNIEFGGRNSPAAESTKEILRQQRRGRKQTKEWVQNRIDVVANKVIYLDKEKNEILEEYSSLANAGRENPRNDSYAKIGRICRGEMKECEDNIIYCYLHHYELGQLPKYITTDLRKFSELSSDELDEALVKYNGGQSIRSIANDLNTHFGNINSYLKDKTSDNIKMFPYDNFNVLKCVETGKLVDDVHNKSGGVLKHLRSVYPDLVVESNYKRKQIEKETGKYWYHDYFEFENINKDFEVKKCYYCNWVTKDINNESGAYEKHLKVAHDISLNKYVEENPKDRLYFKKEIYDELVECGVCGDEFKILNHTHLKTHNMSVVDYKLEYGSDNMVSKESSQKLKDGYDKYLKFQPFKKSSSLEETIINAIPEIDFEVSNRTILDGMEIDLYCKEKNIGIEVNGCLYHTEIFGKKDRNYHLNKTKGCLEKNIKLIHIFEDEVSNPLVINKIKNILGIDKSERIYARNTTVVKIEESFIKNEFMNKHHIQGRDRSDIAYGAYYNDNLIAVMCFNNKRQMNKSNTHDENTYELTRFATHTDYNIVGVASKLLKRFIDENSPKKIISFADIRWTPNKDNMYQRIGFELVKTLKPDYMYYNPKISRYKRHHKFGFGKSQLRNKYPDIYSDNKTEWQMMQEKGFDRIWDCGKYRYEMDL